ncbi:hypothetical protein [Amycolatopsis decaplanina]|nr:hypothetical protein [Amycolatopsis decaplanina]
MGNRSRRILGAVRRARRPADEHVDLGQLKPQPAKIHGAGIAAQ